MNKLYTESGNSERLNAFHREADEYRLMQEAYPEKHHWFLGLQLLWQRFTAWHNKILHPNHSRPGGENV
jgi:hypothetical protein